MSAGSGTPSIRIWPTGTHRLLGVVSVQHAVADDAYEAEIPRNAKKLLTSQHNFTAWGDFYVCPVAPERRGSMRFVVVKKASNLQARRESPPVSTRSDSIRAISHN
jgi:hypothetical protein